MFLLVDNSSRLCWYSYTPIQLCYLYIPSCILIS